MATQWKDNRLRSSLEDSGPRRYIEYAGYKPPLEDNGPGWSLADGGLRLCLEDSGPRRPRLDSKRPRRYLEDRVDLGYI